MTELLSFEKRCSACGITFTYQSAAPIAQPLKCNECYEDELDLEPLSTEDNEDE